MRKDIERTQSSGLLPQQVGTERAGILDPYFTREKQRGELVAIRESVERLLPLYVDPIVDNYSDIITTRIVNTVEQNERGYNNKKRSLRERVRRTFDNRDYPLKTNSFFKNEQGQQIAFTVGYTARNGFKEDTITPKSYNQMLGPTEGYMNDSNNIEVICNDSQRIEKITLNQSNFLFPETVYAKYQELNPDAKSLADLTDDTYGFISLVINLGNAPTVELSTKRADFREQQEKIDILPSKAIPDDQVEQRAETFSQLISAVLDLAPRKIKPGSGYFF